MHKGTLAAGGFVEVCGRLPSGLKVRSNLETSTRVGFNIITSSSHIEPEGQSMCSGTSTPRMPRHSRSHSAVIGSTP